MAITMNRQDLQQLARVRFQEAKALLDAGRHSGAYFLAGFAVESTLKAYLAKMTVEHDFPPRPSVVRDYYSHDLAKLRRLADLERRLQSEAPSGSPLDRNWAIVLQWKSDSRYRTIPGADAQDLYTAIADPVDGVLAWLQRNW